MNPNIKDSGNLIGKKVRLRLQPHDKETLEKLRRPLPKMPIVTGTMVKRFFSFNWGYVVELNEPLFLDIDGISETTRRVDHAKFIGVTYGRVSLFDGKDPFYLELTGKSDISKKMCSRSEEGEIGTFVIYINDPTTIPNEIDKNDDFWKQNPFVCRAWVKLID